jgi:RNA-directed DNA polymerase
MLVQIEADLSCFGEGYEDAFSCPLRLAIEFFYMKTVKLEGWFRPRGYSHFDYPLSFGAASRLVANPSNVENHSFLPLISFTDVKRQFRTDNSDQTIPRKSRPKIVKSKKRDLRYASHHDSAIFAYYANSLQGQYEVLLKSEGLDGCVIGYRSGLGSNIDLAASAFTDIAQRGEVTALCFDIENFFPSISQSVLKSSLLQILGVKELSRDWYVVFKNVCRYAHVELKELGQIEGFNPEKPPFPLVDNIPSALKRCRGAKIVNRNKSNCDVPQGTPISAVFANASMLEFDRALQNWVKSIGGSYRRYSDDIMLLVSPRFATNAQNQITNQAKLIGLTINSKKTEISHFSLKGGVQISDVPITYLGFTFDGKNVGLRSRTLSRYYRRMTYATRRTVKTAGKAGQTYTNAFKRQLFSDFTHLGRRNFYSYAKRADIKFTGSIVKKQLRRHFQILLRKLKNQGR